MAELKAGFALDTLSRCQLFAGLGDDLIDRVAAIAEENFCDPGELIFCQGDAAERLYVVQRGRVNLLLRLPDGHEISVMDVGPDSVFGWSALVEPPVYTGTARCGHESALIVVPRRALETILLDEPHAGYTVMKRVASLVAVWLRDTQMQLIEALRD